MKKPTKPVPMPVRQNYFECGWKQLGDKIEPVARLIPWSIPVVRIDTDLLALEYTSVLRWLANPEKPKGVRL
jgi:hypothetical protein